MDDIIVQGAYGRDYTSAQAAIDDWNNDKDFRVISMGQYGRYVNKQDADRDNLTIKLRYHNLARTVYLRKAK